MIVFSGGGLSSWYVCERLHRQGENVVVWSARTGQLDEPLEEIFLRRVTEIGLAVVCPDLRPALAALGLEVARAQARHRSGYWNTTGALRVALIAACAEWVQSQDRSDHPVRIAHGCVGFGNDQRRFQRLFAALLPGSTVQPCLAEWGAAGQTLSRAAMAQALRDWSGLAPEVFAPRIIWSSDGSILGVSHEGSLVEDHASDWTTAPFAMTRDPLADGMAEDVVCTFQAGRLTAVGTKQGSAEVLLGEANRIAGAHGIGRISVMEDRLKGTKCRGIYEAPGLTLLGSAWAAIQELCLPASVLARLDALSSGLAEDLYGGGWHEPAAVQRRSEVDEICAPVAGSVLLTLRGGLIVPRLIEAVAAGVERRFATGGVAWSESGPSQH